MKAKLPFYKSHFQPGESEFFYRTVDLSWPSDSRMKVMTGMAQNMWGDINHRHTLFNTDNFSAMFFSCSGHGGYMLFSTNELEFLPQAWEASSKDYNYEFPSEWYIYSFEEDCNWAMFWLMLNPKMKEKEYKKSGWGDPNAPYWSNISLLAQEVCQSYNIDFWEKLNEVRNGKTNLQLLPLA